MIASGYTYRNILNQTGNFKTNWRISADNKTGVCEFGLSGSVAPYSKYSYFLSGGEIYDSSNKLITSYENGVSFTIQNNFINQADTFIFNNEVQYFHKPIGNNYNFNYFYVNPSGCTINFDFQFQGETTELEAFTLNAKTKDLNTNITNRNITGRLINKKPDLEVKVFGADVQQENPSYYIEGFPISFYQTGEFYIKPIITDDAFFVDEIIPIRFYTNFGNIDKNISITGKFFDLEFDYLFTTPSGEDILVPWSGLRNVYLYYGNNTGASLKFNLTYESGETGYIYGPIPVSGNYSTIISGYVSGSGYISKIIEDYVNFTGYNDFEKRRFVSGVTGFEVSKYIYATGFVEYNYSLTGTGLGTGIIYKDIYSSGLINRKISGYVPYLGGGTIFFGEDYFLGTGFDADENNNKVIITGYAISGIGGKKLYYTGSITGIDLNEGQYYDKLFEYKFIKEDFYYTAPAYTLTGTGYATNFHLKTGIVDEKFFINFDEGYYFFDKEIKSQTGFYSISDETKVITGLSGLLNCNFSNERKYIGIGNMSGNNNFHLFISACHKSGIYFKYLATGSGYNIKYYILNSSGEPESLDINIPKFVTISPSQEEMSFNRENIDYLTNNIYGSEIRTRISHIGKTLSGSGYFNNIFSAGGVGCDNSGVWIHEAPVIEKIDKYYSPLFLSNVNVNILSHEDTYYHFYDNSLNLKVLKSGTRVGNIV
jgi:hypothetical protein